MTPGEYVLLSVTDTGQGMDDATRARIFEPFFTTKEIGKGTGLGLATVYGIIKQSGGFIWVTSSPGKGTTFEIYLPQADGVAAKPETEATPSDSLRGTETVLVVEDEAGVRELACQFLRVKGYNVLDAENGQQALEIASKHSGTIDLLLSDMIMPKMNGGELAGRLKTIRPGIRVAFMSGYSEFSRGDLGRDFPEAPVLQKPFSPVSLVEIVRTALTPSSNPRTDARVARVPRYRRSSGTFAGDFIRRPRIRSVQGGCYARQGPPKNPFERLRDHSFVVCSLIERIRTAEPKQWRQRVKPAIRNRLPEVRHISDALRPPLVKLIGDLQTQVQTLNALLSDLRAEQQRTSEDARELRRELDLVKAQTPPIAPGLRPGRNCTRPPPRLDSNRCEPASAAVAWPAPQEPTTSDRIAKLEENQDVLEGKVNDQYQTKVESGSKYRLRLSGIVLLNLYDNRGPVDNQDFPQLAEPPQSHPLFVSPGAFGGSLRQSQIKLQAFGPDLFGARTSADLEFDFAGGFADQWNGVSMGLVRLRTGTMRMDWTNTSIVAGQDRMFFAPLAPTSLASMAIPALSYTGNLWAWMPQVRVEHRFPLSDVSNIQVQAGILDSLTGDPPEPGDNTRFPSWGEMSGQPAYATRISWSHRVFGQNLTVGVGWLLRSAGLGIPAGTSTGGPGLWT